MGCKSAAKSKPKEETVASSSSLLSFSRYNQTIQSSVKRKTIQEQEAEHGKSSSGDEEESEESNTAARVSSGKSFLRESGTSGIADSSVTR